MTHPELLAKIDGWLAQVAMMPFQHEALAIKAMRKIAEIHAHENGTCYGCVWVSDGPCETWDAVAEVFEDKP